MQKKILKEGFKNTGRIILALALLAPFGCGESSCNDPGYQYPFESPGSGISPQVVRTRITEWGLTTLARAIPGVLVDSCTPEVGDVAERSCFLETDSSTGSDIAQFYLGKPEDDPGDDSTGIRSGGVCSSCPGGAYHRSTLGFYLDSLENNILLRPVPGADGGHLEMILGCDPDASTCLSSQHIRGAIDMVFLPGYQACSMTNGVEEGYGFVLEWLKVSIKMRVVEDESGHRFLNVADDDIEVKDGDISLKIDMALIDAADDDPACDGALCDVTCGSSDIAIDFTAGLLTDLFKDEVIKLLTTGITSALGGDELDGSGHVNTGELIPLPNQNTNEVGYYLGANLSTPDVSGPIGNYGLNFDTDMGLSAEHHPCVPPVPAPPVQGGPMPEPDVLVPVIEEAYDLVIIAGDAALNRASFKVFDSGSLCFDLPADSIEDITDGVFSSTVASLGLIAPGLLDIADPNAPVDIRINPHKIPRLVYGTGEGVGEDKDSVLQILWSGNDTVPGLEIDFYPLVDGARLRALSFGFDLEIGVTVEPTPTGDAVAEVDWLRLANMRETYNEIGTTFDVGGVEDIVELFMPMLLDADSLTAGLDELVGYTAFAPKLRSVSTIDEDRHFLGIYFRFCTADDLDDPWDTLCNPNALMGNWLGSKVDAQLISAPGKDGLEPDQARLLVESELGPPEELQLAYSVDDSFLWGFRNLDADGTITIQSALLLIEGEHKVRIILRRPGGQDEGWIEDELVILGAIDSLPRLTPVGSTPVTPALEVMAESVPLMFPLAEADELNDASLSSGTPYGCTATGGSLLWALLISLGLLVRRKSLN